MSDNPYKDYRFRFAVADCARVVPSLRGLRNMLGYPLDAEGQPLTDLEEEPAFHGLRIGDHIYVAFRVAEAFDRIPGLTEIDEDESAALLGVWA